MTILLDGAMGTELARRGFELRAPLWGARAVVDAPDLVSAIHSDYARAGAEVLVTASFGLIDPDVAEASVALARRASAKVRIAGSLGPVDPALPQSVQRRHLHTVAEGLVRGGASVLFAETLTTLVGARIAIDVARSLGVPVWVGLACDVTGKTLGGDALEVALGADAVFVGCTEHAGLEPALAALAPHNPVLGARPSLALTTAAGFDPTGAPEGDVVRSVLRCVERFDLHYAGGCCGTTPQTIALLAEGLRPEG